MTISAPGPKLFKVLADDSRLRLIHILRRTEFTVSELVSILEIHQSNISRNMTQLRSAGLVSDRKEGALVYYRISESLRRNDNLNRLIQQACNGLKNRNELESKVEILLKKRKEQSRIFFEKVAGKYRRLAEAGGGSKGLLHILASLIQIDCMVDIGCGDGEISLLFAKSCKKVISVDQNQQILTLLQNQAHKENQNNIETRVGDMEALPLQDEEVDFALLSQALHHASDPLFALKEMVRTLKPNGKYAILDLAAHDQEWVREKLGDRWLGFDQNRLEKWLQEVNAPAQSIEIIPIPDGLPLILATGQKRWEPN